jgi:hypothetical protein
MSEILDQQPMEKKKGNRTAWVVIAVIGAFLVLCFVAIVILVLTLDPWGIVSRLRGGYDPIAQAAPPETEIFMNVDLLKLQSQDFLGLVNTFIEAAGDETFEDFQDLVAKLDETAEEGTDMTFSEDVQPWIGQFVGLGFMDLADTDFLSNDINLYLIVEVRDKKKADDFLDKAMDKYREENDQGFIEEEYEGTTIYEVDTQYDDERLAFGRSGDLLILSTKVDTVKAVIDAKKGDSLADSDDYKAVSAALSKDRILTFYMSVSFLKDIQGDIGLPTGIESSPELDMLNGLGMSISVVDVGLQVDYIISYNPDEMSDEQIDSMQIEPGELMTATLFPQETYLYVASMNLDTGLESLQNGLTGIVEQEDIDEAMEIFEEQYGINPQTDLFPYLDGEFAIGILESSKGLVAEQLGIPLTLLIVVESSDPDGLLNAAEKIAQGLEDTGQFDVLQTESNGIHLFELRDPFYDESAFIYAVKDNILFITFDAMTIEDAYGDRVSLDQYSRYKDGWDAFPKDMRPMMYMDIEGIYRFVTVELGELSQSEVEDAAVFRPIKTIELAGRFINDSLLHGTMIIFIESDSTQ